jgi:hypothetical protein
MDRRSDYCSWGCGFESRPTSAYNGFSVSLNKFCRSKTDVHRIFRNHHVVSRSALYSLYNPFKGPISFIPVLLLVVLVHSLSPPRASHPYIPTTVSKRDLLFYPKDGGRICLQNFGNHSQITLGHIPAYSIFTVTAERTSILTKCSVCYFRLQCNR